MGRVGMKVRLPGPMNIVLPQPLSGSRLVSVGSLAGRVSTETQLTGTIYDGVDFAGQFWWACSRCRLVAKEQRHSPRGWTNCMFPSFSHSNTFSFHLVSLLDHSDEVLATLHQRTRVLGHAHYVSIQWGKSSIPQFSTANVWIMT